MNSWYLATSILLAACLSLLLGCGRPSSNNDDNDDDSEADDGRLVADDDSGDDLIDDVISNDDAGFYSTDGWCWQNPWPQGNAISAVWVASTTYVFAVGSAGPTTGRGTILHFDGNSW